MRPQPILAAVSAAQLAIGLAGLSTALRRSEPYDLRFARGAAERIGRDQWITGTALSAPGVLLVAQAILTATVAWGPSRAAVRLLGLLGGVFAIGYALE